MNDSFRLLDLPADEDLRFHPRNQCIHQGYASVALVPIRSKGRVVGLIQLNDRRKGQFFLDIIELLEGIALHIGAALMHKQDEDVLRESAERFRGIVENSSAGYFFIDCDGRYKSVNTAWLHLHKYGSPEEIVGHHFFTTQVESDRSRVSEIIERLLAGAAVGRGEFAHRCKDNSIAWHTFSANPVWQDGEVVGVEGFLIDITERKRVEDALRNSESHLRTLAQTIPDLIWSKDTNGVYLSCNTIFERFFGARQVDIIGKTDYDFVDRELAGLFVEHDRKAMSAEKSTSNEEWITCADDGRRVLLETIRTPMYDSSGLLVGVLGIGRDITTRKQAENALYESEATVRMKLQAILEPKGDIGTLELADIINNQTLQTMMEEFYRLTKIGIGILDVHGNVLVGVGWQEICTRFHRMHPETLKNCIESDCSLSRGITVGTTKAYRCKNNLWDIMTPIEVGGRHLGNVCLGQFFYVDETPD